MWYGILLLAIATVLAAQDASSREKRRFLELTCPQRVIRGGEYVCLECPEGSNPAASEMTAELGSVLHGSFTARRADEALVSFAGCGTQQNFGFYALFRRARGRWKRLAIEGIDMRRCEPAPGPDRMRLLCNQGLFASNVVHSEYHLVELSAAGMQESDRLYTIRDTLDNCGPDYTSMQTRETRTFVDLDGDGIKDLLVKLRVWAGRVPEPVRLPSGRCRTPFPEQGTDYELRFVFRNGQLVPTAETREAVRRLDQLIATSTSP